MLYNASKVTAQMSHTFYWTPPPTTDQHGLFPVALPTIRPILTPPHNPMRQAFPVSAKVGSRLVTSSSNHQAWYKDRA